MCVCFACYIYSYVWLCMVICIYVRMHGYVRIYMMYACLYVFMHVCACLFGYVCMHVCMVVCVLFCTLMGYVHMVMYGYACMLLRIYVRICTECVLFHLYALLTWYRGTCVCGRTSNMCLGVRFCAFLQYVCTCECIFMCAFGCSNTVI